MSEPLNYLWWQADTKREPFADTFAAALAAHAVRFGRAATTALVPPGMAAQLGEQDVVVEERDTVPVAHRRFNTRGARAVGHIRPA